MEKTSVIIPIYNSAGFIGRCISSVLKSGYPVLEIIVVDDASSDDTVRIVEEYRRKYPEIIKLLRHDTNGGPAKARNTGARQAAGDYIFFLDSDTEVLADTLDNFSRRMKEADAVTGIYHFEPLNRGMAQSYKALLNYYFFSRKGVIEYEVFDSSRAGIRKEVFDFLSGFNENLKRGMDYENEDFGYRLSSRYRNLLDPSVTVRHIFPGFKKMTGAYFSRVSLWMQIFMSRKKFESGGVTSRETGISTAALFLAVVSFPLIFIHPFAGFVSLFLFMLYLYGYARFFYFTLKKKPWFLPFAVLLNIYFTIVIAASAFWGFVKYEISKI